MKSAKYIRFRDVPSDVLKIIESSRRGEDMSGLIAWGSETGFLSAMKQRAQAKLTLHLLCDNCYSKTSKQLFEVRKALKQGSKDAYCSAACCRAHHSVKNSKARCKHCGNPLRHRHGRFCDAQCKRAYIDAKVYVRWLKTCSQCGAEYSAKSKYCSRVCADRAHSERMVGAKNSRYVISAPYGQLHRQMAEVIRSRDGNRCVACGQADKKIKHSFGRTRTILHVHHIDEDIQHNLPPNLITLCMRCHKKHHQGTLTKSAELSAIAVNRSASMTSRLKRRVTSLLMTFSRTIASSSTTRMQQKTLKAKPAFNPP